MNLKELESAWNAQADKFNQWRELGLDEIVEFAQQVEREAKDAEIERLRAELATECESCKRYSGHPDQTYGECTQTTQFNPDNCPKIPFN